MKLNVISGRDMCKILEKIEFKRVHQVGSHVRYIHSDGRRTVVPVHGNEIRKRFDQRDSQTSETIKG